MWPRDTFERVLILTFLVSFFVPLAQYLGEYLSGKRNEEFARNIIPAFVFTAFNILLYIIYNERSQDSLVLGLFHPWARRFGPNLLILGIGTMCVEAEI